MIGRQLLFFAAVVPEALANPEESIVAPPGAGVFNVVDGP
jgi:hypothetical protein